jgi:hypothetical protein
MRNRSLRYGTAASALALTSLFAAAACSSAPVGPLPAQTPRATSTGTPSAPTPSVSPTTASSNTAAPQPNPTHSINSPPACLGAVIYKFDASAAGPARSTVCVAVGGVVRVSQLGPDGLQVSGSGAVACDYEAAVHFCRLIETGTVRFAISTSKGTRVLTVVVARASTPPKPSPACQGAVKYTFDASESGPRPSALCMKVGAVLRLENLGPDGLSVSPANLASCWYEAGIHECRLVKAGTVRFTITITHDHSLAVVVIK